MITFQGFHSFARTTSPPSCGEPATEPQKHPIFGASIPSLPRPLEKDTISFGARQAERLTQEQTLDLIQIAQWGNAECATSAEKEEGQLARTRILKAYEPLARGRVTRYQVKMDFPDSFKDDFLNTALLAINRAINHYRTEEKLVPKEKGKKGLGAYSGKQHEEKQVGELIPYQASFDNYCRLLIERDLEKELRKAALHKTHFDQYPKVLAAEHHLTARLGRPPSNREVAEHLKIPLPTLADIRAKGRQYQQHLSLNAELTDEPRDSRQVADTLADATIETAGNALDAIEDTRKRHYLDMAFSLLSPTDSLIIRELLGENDAQTAVDRKVLAQQLGWHVNYLDRRRREIVERMERLPAAISALPREQRAVLDVTYGLQGERPLPIEGTSQKLGLTVKAVATHQRQAVFSLIEAMDAKHADSLKAQYLSSTGYLPLLADLVEDPLEHEVLDLTYGLSDGKPVGVEEGAARMNINAAQFKQVADWMAVMLVRLPEFIEKVPSTAHQQVLECQYGLNGYQSHSTSQMTQAGIINNRNDRYEFHKRAFAYLRSHLLATQDDKEKKLLETMHHFFNRHNFPNFTLSPIQLKTALANLPDPQVKQVLLRYYGLEGKDAEPLDENTLAKEMNVDQSHISQLRRMAMLDLYFFAKRQENPEDFQKWLNQEIQSAEPELKPFKRQLKESLDTLQTSQHRILSMLWLASLPQTTEPPEQSAKWIDNCLRLIYHNNPKYAANESTLKRLHTWVFKDLIQSLNTGFSGLSRDLDAFLPKGNPTRTWSESKISQIYQKAGLTEIQQNALKIRYHLGHPTQQLSKSQAYDHWRRGMGKLAKTILADQAAD